MEVKKCLCESERMILSKRCLAKIDIERWILDRVQNGEEGRWWKSEVT